MRDGGLDGGGSGVGRNPGKGIHLAALLNVLDGLDNVGIRATAADVATHAFADFGGREQLTGGFCEESDGGHDLAGRAIATLEAIELKKGFLHGMECAILREAFDGGDFIVLMGDGQRQAGKSAAAVHMNRACAALALIATFFRAVEAKMLAKGIEQSDAGIGTEGVLGAVDVEI